MKTQCKSYLAAALLTVVLGGCTAPATVKSGATEPEKLTVYADGTMEFRNRRLDAGDVVIYDDGRGGERAAVKISLEPLHPPFYRDSIVVVREAPGS